MRIAVHQPHYMPWLGYLHKIASCDIFVFLDDVQYKKREFQNRNRIKTPNGSMWLTVPVLAKGRYHQNINEVKIDNSRGWRAKHSEAIERNYSSAPYYSKYAGFFVELLNRKWDYLDRLNRHCVEIMMEVFSINTDLRKSSDLDIASSKTERLVEICLSLGADEYLSGSGAKAYMNEDEFRKAGIQLVYQDFCMREYDQQFDGFVPDLSAIDYLFNCGNKFI